MYVTIIDWYKYENVTRQISAAVEFSKKRVGTKLFCTKDTEVNEYVYCEWRRY